MKKFLIFLVLIIFAIAIGAYYYGWGKKDVCKNVIPEDAKAVMVFDSKEAIKQLDFSITDLIDILRQHGDDDKQDVGIDFLTPIYGFVSNDNYLCGVFALSDAKTFENYISNEKYTVESQRGFKWVYGKDILACFDSDKALLMGPVSKAESDGMRAKIVEWMKQGSHKVPMLSSLENKEGILRLRTSYAAIPDKHKATAEMLYKDIDWNKVFFDIKLNVKKNAFLISTKVESNDEKYNKFISEWSNYNRPIQDSQLQTPYDNPLAFAVFNLNGEAIYKKVSENSTYGILLSGLNLYCNAGQMLQAIDGNVCLTIDDVSDDKFKFFVNAQVKNTDFMKGANQWGNGLAALGIQCQQIEGDNYLINKDDSKLYLGVRNNTLYFASDYDLAKEGSKQSLLNDNPSFASQVAGKMFYLSLDFAKLKDIPIIKSALGKNEVVNNILNNIDRLNTSKGENMDIDVELTTKQNISDIIKKNLKK